MIPLPLAEKLFNHIPLDTAGPFPCSQASYQFVLVIIVYATQFLKAAPLQTVTAPEVADA